MYDFYWASHSADSTGLSGMGYNEFMRHCRVTGPVTDQLGAMTGMFGGAKSPGGGGGYRRRRSSFPFGGLVLGGEQTGPKGADGNKLISLAQGAKKVMAMSPRYQHDIY